MTQTHANSILIVDDNINNLTLLDKILSQHGYQVETACNGHEAIELVASFLPDLILLDLNLPDISGIDVCKTIKSSHRSKSVPIILLTSSASKNDIIQAFEAGAIDYITKPFHTAELLVRIETQTSLRAKDKKLYQYTQILEQSPVSIIITDLKGHIEWVNPEFLKICGYKKDEIIGKNPSFLKTDTKSLEEYEKLWETISSGNVWQGEFLNKRKDGSTYWVSGSISPIKEWGGNFEQYLGVMIDITAKKQADEILHDAFLTIRKHQQQIEQELEQARITQLSILPLEFPDIPDIDIAAKYDPMDSIGGDFYNVIQLDETHFGFMIADVTGHGVSAALLSFLFSSTFSYASNSGISPSMALNLTNAYVQKKVEEGKFATMFYAVYDTASKSLTYSGAGHPAGMILRNSTGEILELKSTGFMVGLFPPSIALYDDQIEKILPGDRVFLYTDGIIETENQDGEIMGVDGLKNFLKTNQNLSIQELLNKVSDYANEFSNYAGIGDDVTMLAFEVSLDQ